MDFRQDKLDTNTHLTGMLIYHYTSSFVSYTPKTHYLGRSGLVVTYPVFTAYVWFHEFWKPTSPHVDVLQSYNGVLWPLMDVS